MTWEEFIAACASLPGTERAEQPQIDGLRVGSVYYAYPCHADGGAFVSLKVDSQNELLETYKSMGAAHPAFYPHKSWWMIYLNKLEPTAAFAFAQESHSRALKRLRKSERDLVLGGSAT